MFRFDDPDEYLTSYRDFQRMVTGRDVMAELFDEDKAVLIYDLHTATPAGTRRTAEWFRVDQSKTRSILLIFDATPWRPILRLRQPRESFEEKLKIGVL
jgi:hypothetical protein